MKTLGSVESLTGGLFASEIVSKPGASQYFKGALVLYSDELKQKFGIDISQGTINEKVAIAMAEIGRKILNVDVCIALTGNAGPSASDDKNVGNVWIAINEHTWQLNLQGSRCDIRKQCVAFGLKKIKELYELPNI